MPESNGASWEAVSALLDELLDLDDAQRAARLAQLRVQDPALSDQAAELLAQQAAVQMEQFLEGSAVDPLGLGELAGRTFGGYTLDRPLGEGGMGSVWLARRSDGRYEGEAAVKLLNLGLLGRDGAERLRHEANALAKLARTSPRWTVVPAVPQTAHERAYFPTEAGLFLCACGAAAHREPAQR